MKSTARRRSMRIAGALAASGLLAFTAACSSSEDSDSQASASPTESESPSATSSPEPTETSASPTSSPTETSASPTSSPSDSCTEQAILDAIPQGAEMVRFTCASDGTMEYAAAEVNPGPTVFFLTLDDGTWDVSTSDEVCGTASAGYPPEILDYCPAS